MSIGFLVMMTTVEKIINAGYVPTTIFNFACIILCNSHNRLTGPLLFLSLFQR